MKKTILLILAASSFALGMTEGLGVYGSLNYNGVNLDFPSVYDELNPENTTISLPLKKWNVK